MKIVGVKVIADSCQDESDYDDAYFELFMAPVRKCKDYKPKFGINDVNGVDLSGFKSLYGSDPFYSWIGIDSDLMYSAHKAAGGMTSVYRQIGLGCEKLFRRIIMDSCLYGDAKYSNWSYETRAGSGKSKTLYLDGRLELDEIKNLFVKKRVKEWMTEYCQRIDVTPPLHGVVFEVRQGYKSKDSKRQNGDIDNATVAWASGYLPIFAIFSSQIDKDLVYRYVNNRCGILTGVHESEADEYLSLFSFIKNVLGYDLSGFFLRNSDRIKNEMNSILSTLLSAR
ncbi:hypothetical protein [Musicola keenii]|uniref:hypothetical protein n=1 Tax=Musicola keenii TaxID=2884250 RepID=UPI00177CC6DB|nr:hypothetical protein [Musicola keenii]